MGVISWCSQRKGQGLLELLIAVLDAEFLIQVNVHCYEAVDLDAIVRVSNSVICCVSLFDDPLSYRTNSNSLLLHSTMLAKRIWSLVYWRKHMVLSHLLPDDAIFKVLVVGEPPGVALFATFARWVHVDSLGPSIQPQSRYKREAYRASEFAPRILTQHGIPVMMKAGKFEI